jgi:hypothetical protein
MQSVGEIIASGQGKSGSPPFCGAASLVNVLDQQQNNNTTSLTKSRFQDDDLMVDLRGSILRGYSKHQRGSYRNTEWRGTPGFVEVWAG